MFITDEDGKSQILARPPRTLNDLPENILVCSGAFDVGRSDITRAHLETFDESSTVVRGGSWLHKIGAYWGMKRPSNAPAKTVWTSTMKHSVISSEDIR